MEHVDFCGELGFGKDGIVLALNYLFELSLISNLLRGTFDLLSVLKLKHLGYVILGGAEYLFVVFGSWIFLLKARALN